MIAVWNWNLKQSWLSVFNDHGKPTLERINLTYHLRPVVGRFLDP